MQNARRLPAYSAGFLSLFLLSYGVTSLIIEESPKPSTAIEATTPEGESSQEASGKATGSGASPTRRLGPSGQGETVEPVGNSSEPQVAPSSGSVQSLDPKSPESPAPSQSTEPQAGVTVTPEPGPGSTTNPPNKPATPKPEKPVYEFFVADDSEQNRTWCDSRPSGSVKVVIGTMYRSFYNDNDPSKAFFSNGYSKEDETCP